MDLGEIRKPADARPTPHVAWPQKKGELYSVIMFDPDVPSRQVPWLGSWLHWWAGNISPDKARQSSTFKPYTGPSPPPGTGYHRYIFLVCRQTSGEIKPFVPFRGRFGIRERLKMHDLQVVAINFFHARRG